LLTALTPLVLLGLITALGYKNDNPNSYRLAMELQIVCIALSANTLKDLSDYGFFANKKYTSTGWIIGGICIFCIVVPALSYELVTVNPVIMPDSARVNMITGFCSIASFIAGVSVRWGGEK
jgi:hypothetical protein